MFSPLEQFNVIPVILWFNISDYSFTNVLLPLLIILVTSLIVIKVLKNKTFLIPTLFQYIIEMLTEFIFSILKHLFFPLIFTLFNFILLSNYISLLPMGIALTSHIVVTLFLSVSMCLSIFVFV
jgi:F-type H+-transporting ATPase subunit a